MNRLLPGRGSTERALARPRVPLVVTMVIALVTAGLGLLWPSSASAAGSGVLDIVITPVDLSNGATITDIEDGTHDNKVTYRVQYSCTTAACDGTQVQFSTPPVDPHGLLPAGQFILMYGSWVQPGAGGTIGGTDATGKVVDLGNLAAGTSGTFSVTYGYQASRNREIPNGSFYPEGTSVPMSATISSDSATGPKTSNSAVTWHIGTPAGPTSGLGTSNPTFDTDVQESYRIAVNPGNMRTNPGANVAGDASLIATGNYKIVYTVPAEAVIDEASDDGVIDNVNHTVTWTKGSVASPSYGARGGWGLAALSGFNSGGAATNNGLVGPADAATWGPRTVKVTFPGSNFPEADPTGCNFVKDVTSSLAVTVNYLDSARTQKTLNRDLTTKVACTNPFGGILTAKTVSNGVTTNEGDGDLGGGILAVNTPAPGEADAGNCEWRVSAGNVGNVDATVVIDEPNLDQDHIKVQRIIAYQYAGAPAGWEATVDWVDNTGATGTAQLGNAAFVDAQPGRWFVSARTTAPLPAGRILPSDNTATTMQMGYRFKVDDGAIPLTGEERTNTANVSMSYPADADGDGSPDDYTDLQGQPLPTRQVEQARSRTVRYTQPLATVTPGFVGTPVVDGGGNPMPGTEVTFSMRALTSNVWPGTSVQPQLVFLAPVGWEVVPGSASFTGAGTGVTATAPAGVTYAYRTVTIGGEQRSVAVATYPSAVALSSATNDYWPTLSVKARPTLAAVPGVQPIGAVWAGDQSGTWRDATGQGFVSGPNQFRVTALAADAGDVDADGDTTEEYAAQTTAFNLAVGASDGLSVVKELCVPDDSAADGCAWVADPTQVHEIPVAESSVKYRITLRNAGNTTLHDVVGYDVLPYVGDTGLLANPPARGSQFDLLVDSVESSSANLLLSYSASTNPARPEVNPGAAGTVNDWGAGAAGKKAIRMAVDGDLAAGATAEVVLVAAVAPGSPTNKTACNTVAADSNETLPAEPLAVCVIRAAGEPGLTLDKTAAITTDNGTPGVADEGDVITYTFTTDNTGNVPLADVSIDDPKAGLSAIMPASVATVAPGDDAEFTATYTVTQTDVDNGTAITNTATAEATDPNDGDVVSPPDSTSTNVAAATPSLLTDKEAELDDANGNGVADEGETIAYTFTVRNDGNVTVTGVSVDDPMVSGIVPASVTLAPGGSQTFTADDYVVTQTDIDNGGPIVNRASASGTGPDGGDVTSPEDTTSTDTVEPDPGLAVEKSAQLTTDEGTAGAADEGDVITYSFEVTNTGNVTMTNVAIDDVLPGLSPTSPLQVATLAPGADTTFTATYTVTQADVDAGTPVHNSAVAEGRAPDGATTTSVPDTTDTAVVAADPGLAIDKTAMLGDANANGTADKGEVIAYTFTVTNSGNVTLSGVKVTDLLAGLTAVSPVSVATLAPGADAVFTASYTTTQADVDRGGSIDNSATAAGNAPNDDPVTSDPDTTGTNLVPGAPGIVLDKKSVLDDTNGNGKADVGEEIAYTFEVENTGNVTASNVVVTDPEVSDITPASATIAPGDTVTFAADPYVVTQGDVDDGVVRNVASSAATVPGGATVTSEDVDEVDTVEAHPDLAVVKSAAITLDAATAGKADVDDVVTYTFTVTNNGGATALDVSVSDALPGLSPVSPATVASIAPGASVDFTATYTAKRSDVERGSIENTAAVTGRGPVRGGVTPPAVTLPSNEVTTATGGLGAPSITTVASDKKVAMSVGKGGVPEPARLHDMVTISGLVVGGDTVGTATLYGPVAKVSDAMCVPGKAVASVSFAPVNGTVRTPSVKVSEPGYYTWVVSTSADRRNDAASHGCGLASETTLVHRAEVGKVKIETGYAGTEGATARKVRPSKVSIPGIGMKAKLTTVGVRKGSMVIPQDVARGGWLQGSAAPGEVIGSSVIAGHVSDRADRPGAFGKLHKARKGQVIKVRAANGTVHRYRIASVHTQLRKKGFAGAEVSTTGEHQLTLVTCTGKVTYANGRYHYTKNLVVIATPIG
ncbi:DUF11 domain-containing protein [Nocardioides carbamazepini]|uniref:DUF7507 domain-containing protein n=1 Tax=Nocardioides carbamazepini TaxID=2854259 RepID=UPI00214A0FDF|nr:sortase [Nocardioides carbamazepini]MCR1785275.1 DUF11 domain-containing protein [Nocardioides carbamazepini]